MLYCERNWFSMRRFSGNSFWLGTGDAADEAGYLAGAVGDCAAQPAAKVKITMALKNEDGRDRNNAEPLMNKGW